MFIQPPDGSITKNLERLLSSLLYKFGCFWSHPTYVQVCIRCLGYKERSTWADRDHPQDVLFMLLDSFVLSVHKTLRSSINILLGLRLSRKRKLPDLFLAGDLMHNVCFADIISTMPHIQFNVVRI